MGKQYKEKLIGVELSTEHPEVIENPFPILNLTYEREWDDGKIEHVTLNSVLLPIDPHMVRVHRDDSNPFYYSYACDVHRNRLVLELFSDEGKVLDGISTKVVKEADPVEMTMSEIEAKLGHKIKIVNKEAKDD